MKVITPLFLLFLVFWSCSNIEPLKKIETNPVKKEKSTLSSKIEKKPVPQEVIEKKEDSLTPIKTLTFKNSEKVNNYCEKLDLYFKKYKWGKSNCKDYSWHHVRNSHWGNPIIWFTYGDEKAHKEKPKNTTLIFCGVHGDEITPVKFCFDILEDLKNHPEVVADNLVVIAPLVAPDSFLKKYPTRTNGRGIDVNRNFPTKDWQKNAKRLWATRYSKDKRRYPGEKPLSEQETIFQVNLIKRYNPNKIISVHAPLTLIDYDGPTVEHKHGGSAHDLLIQMSDKAGKYRINNYPFFTGSLGNWAGNERSIPTYTLELPNSDWTKTKKFFNTFKLAIHHAITHDLFPTSKEKKKVTESKNAHSKENDKFL